MRIIYLSGPMRGIKWFNFPAFAEAEQRLMHPSVRVISPAQMDLDAGFDPYSLPADYDWRDTSGFDLQAAIERDYQAIMRADAIAMLPGWELSVGARWEYYLARMRGIDVLDAETGERLKTSESIMQEAHRVVYGARAKAYGHPRNNFELIARLWSVVLGAEVTHEQVAMCMIQTKVAREMNQHGRDNLVDIAGYAGTIERLKDTEHES